MGFVVHLLVVSQEIMMLVIVPILIHVLLKNVLLVSVKQLKYLVLILILVLLIIFVLKMVVFMMNSLVLSANVFILNVPEEEDVQLLALDPLIDHKFIWQLQIHLENILLL